jgi:UDP:flavonoid glycosyltransferase YjiC (YdhE family)
MIVPGSRGDVQPHVALGKGLQAAGMPVRVVTTHDHAELVVSHGLEFWPVEIGMEEIVRGENMRKALETGNPILSIARMAGEAKKSGLLMAERSLAACEAGGMLLAGISGGFLAQSLSEKTGVPLVLAYNVPITPPREFPGALLPGLGSLFRGALNRLSHRLTLQIAWQAYRPVDRLVRGRLLDLPPATASGPIAVDGGGGSPVLYGISPSVIRPPADWDATRVHLTGYWFLDPPDGWEPPGALARFLASGSPPVYVGFGSMSSRDPAATAATVLAAIRLAGQRAIVHRGWGGMHAEDLPHTVFMVDSVPHAWLFPRMAAVVHHGGAGTTAAGLASGVPSIVVPFHGDQPFWGQRVEALGAGPAPIPRKRLNAEGLARAIDTAMTDQAMRARAAEPGARIRAEYGVGRAVALVTGAAAVPRGPGRTGLRPND